eukprot:SAG31_NODE_1654_length_7621_cov_3.273597_3_plen_164_part_00
MKLTQCTPGDGVEQDNAAATHWLRQAAEQGCEQSLRLLEQLHIHTVAVSEHQPRSSHNAGSGGEEHNERKALGQAELQRGLELVFSKSYGDAIEAFRAAHAALGPVRWLPAQCSAAIFAITIVLACHCVFRATYNRRLYPFSAVERHSGSLQHGMLLRTAGPG